MRPLASAPFEIESQTQAELHRDDLAKRLGWLNPVTKEILACDADNPCHLAICPHCAHSYREETIPQLASLFELPLRRLSFATMYVRVVRAGKLLEVDVATLKESLRKIVARADVSGRGLIIGAVESEWRASERKWLLHAHVITADDDDEFWARVRAALDRRVKKKLRQNLRSNSGRRALVVKPVTDLLRQLSYCMKFVTYDRLQRSENGGAGKAVPLQRTPLAELASWRARCALDDLLFLYGAKRLNRRFTRLARAD